MNIFGKMPRQLYESLKRLNVIVNDIQVSGDDIDIVFDSNGTSTLLYAIYVGNGKWLIDELEDDLNIFPTLQEGDTIGLDAVTKQFVNSINSSLILSFNPLGRVKYGIKDKIDKVKDVGRKVVDWATDKLYAEDAEKWLRANGPYRRTFTDKRDGKPRIKKDYSAGSINVGKLESLGKQGHYKVLSGNPDTQDFQVWHLYKNGNKIRCLDVKTGLQAQEAQWVYDNNIPKSWSEADWNPSGEIPEKANKIEIGETEEQKNQTEEDNVTEVPEQKTEEVQTEEDNVTEEPQVEETQVETVDDTEEDNVTEIDDMDPDTWFAEDESHDIVTDEEDNVTEEPKKKKKNVAASLVKSSIEDSDSDFGGYIDEDNVIESKPKKKSKYNGMNVTGYQNGTVGPMTVASGFIKSCLILSTIEEFQQKIRNYNLGEEPKKFLLEILPLLYRLPKKDRLAITENSSDNMLCFNFGKSDLTTESYNAEFKIFEDKVVAQDINMGNGQKIEGTKAAQMCMNTLKSMVP